MRTILFLIFLLAPTSVLGQLKAPQSVGEGQAIHFTLEDNESGLEAVWTVLNPFDGVVITEIRPKDSTDFIVDPPIGWTGKIRVQLILLDAERRVVDIRLSIVQVGSPDNPPNPPNPPPKPDENDPKDDYTGLNDLGMGQESYDLAPNAADVELEMVAKVMDKAGRHLRGFGGLKVVKASGSRANTDFEVYVWLGNQMKDYPEFNKWYEGCLTYKQKLGVGIGSPIDLHVQLLDEMAAGLRGAK